MFTLEEYKKYWDIPLKSLTMEKSKLEKSNDDPKRLKEVTRILNEYEKIRETFNQKQYYINLDGTLYCLGEKLSKHKLKRFGSPESIDENLKAQIIKKHDDLAKAWKQRKRKIKQKITRKRYYLEHREKELRLNREYVKRNKEKRDEYMAHWREKNRDHIREYSKEYYNQNVKERREYAKKYRERVLTKD